MDINCSQFEGLLSFYLNDDLNENLKCAFEEHMKTCPTCNMRYSVVSSVIEDIKSAYDEVIGKTPVDKVDMVEDNEDVSASDYDILDGFLNTELSAYVDNELDENRSVKIRRDIISKPRLRQKVEKLYGLKKVISDSYKINKNKLKTDFSKEIIRKINNIESDRQIYFHCTAFILVVILAIVLSVVAIIHII